MLLSDDNNRHPNFYNAVDSLFDDDYAFDDKDKITAFRNMRLQDQHKISEMNKPYLQDELEDNILKGIPVLIQEFYQFVLPDEVMIQHFKERKEKDMKRLQHKTKPTDFYNIDKEKIDAILAQAKDILTWPAPTTNVAYLDTINALNILTGRRNIEIVKLSDFKPGPNPYQALVNNLAKQTGDFLSTEYRAIPLLAPYDSIKTKFDQLRAFQDLSEMPNHEVSVMMANLSKRAHRLFGVKLVHTQKRQIYAELAWSQRHQNQFTMDSNDPETSSSKYLFMAKALGHNIPIGYLPATIAYQTMNFDFA